MRGVNTGCGAEGDFMKPVTGVCDLAVISQADFDAKYRWRPAYPVSSERQSHGLRGPHGHWRC
eukprot:868781-Prymnesium_polylepis.1